MTPLPQKGFTMTDTEYLQSLLDASDETVFPAVNPRTGSNVYTVESPLVLDSHKHVTLDGCVLRLADGVYSNVFISRGAWEIDPAPLSDISIAGINGAALDGGTEDNGLHERTAFTDGRPAVLHNTFLLLRHVSGFRVGGLRLMNPRYWCMTFYYCWDGVISDLAFEAADNVPNQDGIDLRAGCHDILIENLTGSTGDDTVALTALGSVNDGKFAVARLPRDIHHVVIRNVSAEVTGGHGIIRLLCHDNVRIHDILVENIYDRSIDSGGKICQAAVRIGDVNYFTVKRAEPGDIARVTVRGVRSCAREIVKIAGGIDGYTEEDVVRIAQLSEA